MFPRRGMRAMLALIASAPLIGAMIVYGTTGGSVWPPLILGVFITAGALGFAWFLAGKTGVRRDWQRARAVARALPEEDR